jgi:hypothetical protein
MHYDPDEHGIRMDKGYVSKCSCGYDYENCPNVSKIDNRRNAFRKSIGQSEKTLLELAIHSYDCQVEENAEDIINHYDGKYVKFDIHEYIEPDDDPLKYTIRERRQLFYIIDNFLSHMNFKNEKWFISASNEEIRGILSSMRNNTEINLIILLSNDELFYD